MGSCLASLAPGFIAFGFPSRALWTNWGAKRPTLMEGFQNRVFVFPTPRASWDSKLSDWHFRMSECPYLPQTKRTRKIGGERYVSNKKKKRKEKKKKTNEVNIGLILVLTRLLHWPDWALADRFFWGFPVAGVVPQCNLYGPAKKSSDEMGLTELLGEDADVWNSNLASDRRVHETDSAICDSTRAEQRSGKISPDMSKQQMDKLFGKGA